MPDDYFCPGCGNYTQSEPGVCPLCRTALETINDGDRKTDEFGYYEDDLTETDVAPRRRSSYGIDRDPLYSTAEENFDEEFQY